MVLKSSGNPSAAPRQSRPRANRLPMKISVRSSADDRYAREVVTTALVRSFTEAQVVVGEGLPAACVVWINPPDEICADLAELVAAGGKAIVLGRIGPAVADWLGVELCAPADLRAAWAECPLDVGRQHDVSVGAIRYDDGHPLARLSPLAVRPLCRFDFADEWNNLGFGRLRLDGSAWSLQSAAQIGDATSLARLVTPCGDHLVYSALKEDSSGAALWINRPVGPVDSLEWRVMESFLADYRPDDLPCLPCVCEIPDGFRGAVCARLDCDEAVATAGPLFELYRNHGLPLSLALLTGQPIGPRDIELMRRLVAAGGAVVSHSVHHEPNWGGSYERACAEAVDSRTGLAEHLPEAAPVRYAVSPFHQNPHYAVAALADSGYGGFVGGIIGNDPEYLLGRAGRVPFAPRPIVSLSAQCMLHGDCYRRYGDSVEVYCESFDAHLAARSVFGYLDHPFSARYQYGWPDEATRLAAHARLIEHIGRQSDIWWANLNDLLDFLRYRDAARVEVSSSGRLSVTVTPVDGRRRLAILWKGRQFGQ